MRDYHANFCAERSHNLQKIGKRWSEIRGKLKPFQNFLLSLRKIVYGWTWWVLFKNSFRHFSCCNNENEIHNSCKISRGYPQKLPFWQVWENNTINEKTWAISCNFLWKKIINTIQRENVSWRQLFSFPLIAYFLLALHPSKEVSILLISR